MHKLEFNGAQLSVFIIAISVKYTVLHCTIFWSKAGLNKAVLKFTGKSLWTNEQVTSQTLHTWI